MGVFLTDEKIAELLTEPKQCDGALLHKLVRGMKHKKGPGAGYMENSIEIARLSPEEGRFYIIVRVNIENPLDFSVILGYSSGGSRIFRLRRCNGKSHEHTNRIEKFKFYDFHIHTATERYQRANMKEEDYAEATDRYTDFYGALRCLVSDCGIDATPDKQERLF